MLSSAVRICFFLAGVALVKCVYVQEFAFAKRVGKFSWQNCEKDVKYPVNITELSITPDEIHPGTVVAVSVTAQVNKDIGTTSSLEADVKATFDMSGTVIDLCDYINCQYKDVCAVIKQYQSKCPSVIKKLVPNCQCPLKKNEYKLSNVPVPIPNVGVKLSGDLSLKIDMTESKTKIACLIMKVHVS